MSIAATEATTADAGAAASTSAAKSGGRTQQGAAMRNRGRTQQGTGGGRRVSTAAPRRPAPVRGRSTATGTYRPPRSQRKAPITVSKGKSAGGSNYQNIVLAEFIGAVLLVAATPFAKKNQPGLSPYASTDMLALVAITVLYFILALISGVNSGAARFSAWFGALILLTVGLSEAARLAKLLDVLGLIAPKQPVEAEPEQGPVTQTGVSEV